MSELAEIETFQEKMMTRIRDSIGELISDEELKKILERGIEEALFKPRTVSMGYGRQDIKMSIVQGAVDKFLKDQMEKHVAEWIKNNQQVLINAVEKAARDGAGKIIMQFLDFRFENMFNTAIQNMKMEMQ